MSARATLDARVDHARVLRIRCVRFSPQEIDALRSLLALLSDYLRHAWVVSDSGDADLVLVNLDQADGSGGTHDTGVGVGCAQRPRLHAPGTMHRPLRAAEMLAVLGEAGVAAHARRTSGVVAGAVDWRYRLRNWPAELSRWTLQAWSVMAAISRVPRSAEEIGHRTGMTPAEVEQALAALREHGILERVAERRPAAGADTDAGPGVRWRGLARRVGQLLGFDP